MNFNFFLARKIGSRADATGHLSRTGTIISVVSVAVSIAVIVVATAVSNGFRKEIGGKARGFSGDAVLEPVGGDISNADKPLEAPLSYIDELGKLPFVEQVSPVSYARGILKTPHDIGGILLKGVDSLYNMEFYSKYLCEGKIPSFNGRLSNGVLVSKRLADMFGYKAGSKLTAYFVGEQVKVRRFDVEGIFDTGLDMADKFLVVGDMRHVTRLNGWGDGLSGYEIFYNNYDADNWLERAQQVEDVIYSYTLEGDSPVAVEPLQDKYYVLFDWLGLLDLNVVVILALMIAVAGFNMVSGLLIMLFERISQIGLLKSLGMTNKGVSRIFLTKSALVVLHGMVWGNAIAVVLCLVQKYFNVISLDPANYFVASVPVDFNLFWILAMNAISFVAIMLVMMLPCLFISRIDPASTMRVK